MAGFSERVAFPGHDGGTLAARLDRPAGDVRAFAIFAHCFTCSKDVFAATRVARALAARGVAVLRFDFTGLGHSDGEFSNTSFSSNVGDLVAAAAWLRQTHAAPQLLIGHSLGGAAVLMAAGEIPETRAVATIGAPADAAHVAKSFAAHVEAIRTDGAAKVTLAGRTFTISDRFLKDLEGVRALERVAALRKPLLIFHAPRDETVGIENAQAIYEAAKHPKSFVSLDGADHLLTRPDDAIYVAEILSAWAGRYLSPARTVPATTQVEVTETGESPFQQIARAGVHTVLADEPASVGGANTGPSPYDYLSIALGACTTMTLRMYARHKKLDIGRFSVSVDHGKVHAEDCEDCGEGRSGRIDRFERVVRIEGPVDDATRARLLEIADKCPVHRTLEASSVVVTRFAAPGQTATE